MSLLKLIEGLCPPEGNLSVSAWRCLRNRLKVPRCDACAAACPTNAILLGGKEPIAVDLERCLQCGICAAACPTEALELREAVPARLQQQMASTSAAAGESPGRARLACRLGRRRAADGPAALSVPCLGAVGGEVLAALAVRFGEVELLLEEPECRGCEWREQGWKALENAVETARNTLAFFGLSGEVAITAAPAPPGKRPAERRHYSGEDLGPVASRQEFLRGLMRGAAQAGVAVLPSFLTDGDRQAAGDPAHRGKARLPERRRLLLEALRTALGHDREVGTVLETRDSAAADETPGGLPFGFVHVASSCDACDICSLMCPSGALKKDLGTGTGTLLHEPSRCLKCGTCVRVCPRRAVSLGEARESADILGAPRPVASFALLTCAGCERDFWSLSTAFCPVCRTKLEALRRAGTRGPSTATL